MTNPQDVAQGGRAKKIAVIAVHGISDQKPFASARAIADLLLTQTNPDQSTYTPFNERFIRVKVAPVIGQAEVEIENITDWNIGILSLLDWLLPRKWADLLLKLWQSADERGHFMRSLLTGKPKQANDPLTQPDYLFIRDQILKFEKPSVYDSICLEGQCTVPAPLLDGMTQTQVHIYEMYWADLSRLGTGFIKIFGELYQLLFHLGSLGRQSVDLMRAEHQVITKHRRFGDWLNIWAWYGATQALAGRILSLFLPILNLCLLVVALMSLPGNIPEAYAGNVAALSTGLLLTILVGYVFLNRNKTAFWSWLLWPFCIGIAAALGIEAFVAGAFNTGIVLGAYRWLAVEWVLLFSGVIWAILVKPYSRHRPGADIFALFVGIPLGFKILWLIACAPNTHVGITVVSLHMVEIIYLLLLGGWFVFLLLYFATLVFAGVAITKIKSPINGQTLAKQAAWTARFAIALPALLFSLLTLSLWTAVAQLAAPLLPQEAYKPLLFFKNMGSLEPAKFANQLTVFSGSILAIFIIVATVAALVLLLWVLVPSILTEIFPVASEKQESKVELDPEKQKSKVELDLEKQKSKVEFAQGLGNWLNNGFMLILGPGDWIVSWVIPLLFLIGTVDGISLLCGNQESLLVHYCPFMQITSEFTPKLLTWIAGLLTASATGLIAFGGRLNQLSLGLRGVIDAVLDVDNYLRLHPLDDNPSARIYARYTSLLRYLCHQTTQDGEPYDAFVIVAHSQGTVITADLLRFLAIDPDPALAQLENSNKISLFTMGSPIRQLYSYAFPHLYRWAIQEPTSPQEPTPLKTSLTLPPGANPLPKELLGVRTWVNTFRSGDYVGRYLWRSDSAIDQWLKVKLEKPPQYISETLDQSRREFCLGGGAHTHYWDKTAPEVAQEIDRLIREA
jgi:hypothetical protein